MVTVGSGVGWFFKESAFNFLTVPLKPFTGGKAHHVEFILTKLTDAFVVELKISIAIGIGLVLPVLLYQSWMFVAPAISVHARRYAVPFADDSERGDGAHPVGGAFAGGHAQLTGDSSVAAMMHRSAVVRWDRCIGSAPTG